ncbi:MAG: serpin family protein [Propionicimonas sp.]|uniref:serpin family protein n=1 Tax=Propionicimonas sp. TaxID=1955623 RepID=UPI002B219445|nr:serpin family protein [Propionicimonas sp.]MEA4943341.1 serpin family protein [Propionicimonas sp.]
MVTACSPAPETGVVRADGVSLRQVAVPDATALPSVVHATRWIGTTMLELAPDDQNVVVSPSSLAVALAMLTDGARGQTLAELEAALGADGENRREAFAALRGLLLTMDGDPSVVTGDLPDTPVLHLADQVVVDEEYPVDDDYLTALADGFGAGVQYADLGSQSGKQVLDAWVEHHTGGLVERSAIEPNDQLRIVLQDAIVLAARWDTAFDPAATTDRSFTLADGTELPVETMANGTGWFGYAEIAGWRAVRLPYLGELLAADVVLPPAGVDPTTITPDILAGLASALHTATPEPVDLTLPTLDLHSKLDLHDVIAGIGAPTVLESGKADLSGIGPQGLFVDQAVQQTVLKVDEEGTVAAAVTEIGVRAGAAMPEESKELHADRPFLFAVVHTGTSWPLFLAAVRDPRH